MAESWIAVSLRTGVVIADLPDLVCSQIGKRAGAYTSTSATLPLPKAPADWDLATLPGGAALIYLEDDVPLWGGMVTGRTLSTSDSVPLTLATVEAYLDRRYVGDVAYAATPQRAIVADLVSRYVADAAGIPLRVDGGTGGVARDRTYADSSDKSVYSILVELMRVDGGPEWTIDWEWQSGSPSRITPVLRVADRLGTDCGPGMKPAVTFEVGGSAGVTDLSVEHSYTADSGANSVTAVSTAQGDVRPQSPAQVADDLIRPRFEQRFTPSTSISEIPTLTAHAAARLALVADGRRSVSLTSPIVHGRRLGHDWGIGDCVGFGIPAGLAPAFPGGYSGQGRVAGWDMSLTEPRTVTPILAIEEVD